MNNSEEKRLQQIIQLMESDDSVDAPAGSIRWAKNLFRTRAAEPAPLLQRIVAKLQMDLAPGTAVFGERSAPVAGPRQMLYQAGDGAVALRITSKGKYFDIRGQMIGEGFANGQVNLRGKNYSREVALDEGSEFQIEGVPEGRYSIAIRSSDKIIVMDEILIG